MSTLLYYCFNDVPILEFTPCNWAESDTDPIISAPRERQSAASEADLIRTPQLSYSRSWRSELSAQGAPGFCFATVEGARVLLLKTGACDKQQALQSLALLGLAELFGSIITFLDSENAFMFTPQATQYLEHGICISFTTADPHSIKALMRENDRKLVAFPLDFACPSAITTDLKANKITICDEVLIDR